MLSLSSFHIVFIVASILLSAAVGAWGTEQYLHSGNLAALAMAVTFFVMGFLLLLYGARYFSQLRRLD
jgi:hypothetical protein